MSATNTPLVIELLAGGSGIPVGIDTRSEAYLPAAPKRSVFPDDGAADSERAALVPDAAPLESSTSGA